jgi:cytochrome bd ubiquinol oxidase subunit I
MGLAWFLVYWKWRALRTGDEKYNRAARFWAKIFGLNFAVGVVTGIPMEFQFGTNWAGFSKYSGAIIGQTLAMEGMFAFFLESAFIGALRLVLCRWSSLSLSYCAGDSSRSGCAGART